MTGKERAHLSLTSATCAASGARSSKARKTRRWTGKDAFDFVERVTTADVYGLPSMTGSLSVITNERGGVIDDTLVG